VATDQSVVVLAVRMAPAETNAGEPTQQVVRSMVTDVTKTSAAMTATLFRHKVRLTSIFSGGLILDTSSSCLIIKQAPLTGNTTGRLIVLAVEMEPHVINLLTITNILQEMMYSEDFGGMVVLQDKQSIQMLLRITQLYMLLKIGVC